MLYLVKLDNVYKIGYSDTMESRINSFKTTHIIVDLVAYGEGTVKDEKQVHRLCSEFHIKGELFEVNDKVIEIFKLYTFNTNQQRISELQKLLRKEREKTLSLTLKYDKLKSLFASVLFKFLKINQDSIKISTDILSQFSELQENHE